MPSSAPLRPTRSEMAPQAKRPTPLNSDITPSATPPLITAVAPAISRTSGADSPMAVRPTAEPMK